MEPEGWAVWERTLHSCPEHSEHEGLWAGLRDNQSTVWIKTSRAATLAEGGEQDLISRKAAIDALKTMPWFVGSRQDLPMVYRGEAIAILNSLAAPSRAEPEEIHSFSKEEK
jgi:hypothetical protein